MGEELVSKLIEMEQGNIVSLCACEFRDKYIRNDRMSELADRIYSGRNPIIQLFLRILKLLVEVRMMRKRFVEWCSSCT